MLRAEFLFVMLSIKIFIVVMLSAAMLCDIMQCSIMLQVIMPSGIMLHVNMTSSIMLSGIGLIAIVSSVNCECHFGEYHSSVCRRYVQCHYAKRHYAQCYYRVSHNAECNYAECQGPTVEWRA